MQATLLSSQYYKKATLNPSLIQGLAVFSWGLLKPISINFGVLISYGCKGLKPICYFFLTRDFFLVLRLYIINAHMCMYKLWFLCIHTAVGLHIRISGQLDWKSFLWVKIKSIIAAISLFLF